jgi:hypothetical protein
MAALNADERISLIKENLAEFLNPEIIETIVNEGRNPRIYWGNLPLYVFHVICIGLTKLLDLFQGLPL